MVNQTNVGGPINWVPPTFYRVPARTSGERVLQVLAAIFLVPVAIVALIAALGVVIYVASGVSDAQMLSDRKTSAVEGLRTVSAQREALLPEPAIVARTGLNEISRTSWITCRLQGTGPGLGTTDYRQSCYLTQYIYLDAGRATAEQLPWAAGGISPRGCGPGIYVKGAEESITLYPAACSRRPIPGDAMAVEGAMPGLGSSVVSVGSSYDFSFDLGCKPFSLFCDEPVSEPIRI